MDLLDDAGLNLNTSFDLMFPMSLPPPLPPVEETANTADSYSDSPAHSPAYATSAEDVADKTDVSNSKSKAKASRKKRPTKRKASRKKAAADDDDDFCLEEEEMDDDDVEAGESELAAPRRSKKTSPSSRKRRHDDAVDSVVLDRDELLTISSGEYEELVASVTARRPLSESEKKEVRRQKRLIKNRESAAQSRNRKKQALESLAEENSRLKDEIKEHQTRWSALESILSSMGTLDSVVKQLGAPLGSRRAGAGVFFAILFSFSLFLNLPLLSSSINGAAPGSLATAGDFTPNGNVANLRQLMSLDNYSLDVLECADGLDMDLNLCIHQNTTISV